MNAILQAASDFLKTKKFKHSSSEEGDSITVPCSGEELFWNSTIDTSEDNSIITMLTRLPVKVPVAKRGACAKLLARLNYGKRLGAFHLDLSDGEVMYCISNTLPAGIVSDETLDALLGTTYCAMNKAAPEILKLVYGRTPSVSSEAANPNRQRSLNPPGLTN